MKNQNYSYRNTVLLLAVFSASLAYVIIYFNYFQTPTGDYIGNFRSRVLDYMGGNFPGQVYKILPVYPLVLAALAKLNLFRGHDPIYITALALNICLFVPYFFLTYSLYRRYLSRNTSLIAILFLGVNIYTVYTAVNAELEMLLSLMIVLSLYLTMRDSKISYITAFFTAAIKWDSVFIIPAVMFRDFFYRKRKILSIILGIAATSGVAAWFILSIINTPDYANPYVGEIARRGPNVYRYLIDCFLVTSGFIPWMATQAWFSGSTALMVPLFFITFISGTTVLAGLIAGGILIIKEKGREFAPVMVFAGGFLLIHLIYQNTKARYVLPILWLLNLLLFYGLAKGILPWLQKNLARLKPGYSKSLFIMSMSLPVILLVIVAAVNSDTILLSHVTIILILSSLFVLILTHPETPLSGRAVSIILCFAVTVISFQVIYGARTMDHYSLRRVEFKKAALWFKDNAEPGQKMLITETSVVRYYSGFDSSRFVPSRSLKSNTVSELIKECGEKGITYIFVDDFYIRRYKYHDKNAIERKAWLFRDLRENWKSSTHFRPVKKFTTQGGITSHIYRFEHSQE